MENEILFSSFAFDLTGYEKERPSLNQGGGLRAHLSPAYNAVTAAVLSMNVTHVRVDNLRIADHSPLLVSGASFCDCTKVCL